MADEDQEPSEVNAVLTFHDEDGREWLAGAHIGPLVRYGDTGELERMLPDSMKDRAFTMHGIKLVDQPRSEEENPSA